MNKHYPVSRADIRETDIEQVARVLRSRVLSIGPETEALEGHMRLLTGCKYAIALSSGSAALHLALRAMFGMSDIIRVPTYTFVATANAAQHAGRVLLVDEDPGQRVDVPCHLFGAQSTHAVGPDSIVDACESLGDPTLPLGRAAAYSFWANKQVAGGEGGVLVTDDNEIAEYVRCMRNHGRNRKGACVLPGYNYRITEMSAALINAQLVRLPAILQRRREIAAWYADELYRLVNDDGTPFSGVPAPRISWFVYNVSLRPGQRDRVASALSLKGIQTALYFGTPVHKHPAWITSDDYPCAEFVAARTLSLPFYNELERDDVRYICNVLGAALLNKTA